MYAHFFKRFFDFWISLIALIVLSPLLIILTIIGAIAMKGNPFFTQLRPGRIDKKTGQERIFRLIKFRTMSNARDKKGNLLPDEKRLSRYGKVLRQLSLDEIPEILNILVGNMAIVGPRPLLVRDMVFMSEAQRVRHTIRPGLTGLAQVSGRNNISWERKLDFDLMYIKNISVCKDCCIIFRTIYKVFKKDGIVREGTESDMDLGDWLLKENKVSNEEYYVKQAEAKRTLEQFEK